MMTTTPLCLLGCGRSAVEWHHFTGRAAGSDAYLDPGATIPLDVRCHHTEHQLWRSVGLDVITHPLAARVRRTTWTVGRLADLHRSVVLDPVTLRGLHEVLVAIQADVLALLDKEVVL